jgi:cell division cycle 14
LHCLEGLEWGIHLGWYNCANFNLTDYQFYEKIENGDLNWIIPGKFVAFSTPIDSTHPQDFSFSPDYYVPIFKKIGVTTVVRLNTKEYDSSVKFKLNAIEIH